MYAFWPFKHQLHLLFYLGIKSSISISVRFASVCYSLRCCIRTLLFVQCLVREVGKVHHTLVYKKISTWKKTPTKSGKQYKHVLASKRYKILIAQFKKKTTTKMIPVVNISEKKKIYTVSDKWIMKQKIFNDIYIYIYIYISSECAR